ncbi:hypothetical protein [Nocardia jiangxiensis]|uniref:hypothetical protein n=1 Tax=Nocardia jiangxiensis TaxID=282685 RepID=UPI0002F898A0|nr:hypothetical protein [Nocardia jiangxiensis]
MTELKPQLKTTRFDISCLPENHPEQHAYTLQVEYRGRNKWCVRDGFGFCYDRDGNRSYESLPTNREDEWLAQHRFALMEALVLAKRLAPGIIRGGVTVEQTMDWYDPKECID